jgi:hypothetical protein
MKEMGQGVLLLSINKINPEKSSTLVEFRTQTRVVYRLGSWMV